MDTFIGAAGASADGENDSAGLIGEDVFVGAAVTSGDIDESLGVDGEAWESSVGRAGSALIVVGFDRPWIVVGRDIVGDFVWNDDRNVVLIEVLVEDNVSWIEGGVTVVDANTIGVFDFSSGSKGDRGAIWDGANAEVFEVGLRVGGS